MEVVPSAVGEVSRAWDKQHNDVTAAAGQVGGAPTGCFSPAVTGAAARFTRTWQRHTRALAVRAEEQADGLRDFIADVVSTDDVVGLEVLALRSYLVEHR